VGAQRLFNEIEALSDATPATLETITIPAHERGKRGRKKLSAQLPRVEIVHEAASFFRTSRFYCLEAGGYEDDDEAKFYAAIQG
jgi:hypothetical protein